MSVSQSSSAPTTQSQGACMDPFDSILDLSEYDGLPYQSPSMSSPATTKPQFARSVSSTPTAGNTLGQGPQPLSGPSHQYDLYKQQTGILPGAIANTLAVNQANVHINQHHFNVDYLSTMSPNEELVDFGSAPNNGFYFPERSQSSSGFVNPSAIADQEMAGLQTVPTQGSHVGRLWPGMHQQQAALAKAAAQQKQQQQLIQQRQQGTTSQHPRPQRKAPVASDPIVEEKISQLLNSMRQSSIAAAEEERMSSPQNNPLAHVQRARKDEEEMDEDERLLASEEGKKLSSKERRQLRNKVSARAFRSRRKEYISQLEGEIAGKVNENSELRIQNRALMEENQRLSDLTRMLLSSPAFSSFIDTLSTNPAAPQQQAGPSNSQVENRAVRKDINPYAGQQQAQQHVGMNVIPDQAVDFSMLDLNAEGGFSYQPRVYSVLSVPETPIDVNVLSGKSSNFVGSMETKEEKVEVPAIEAMPTIKEEETVAATLPVDEEFDADPAFALYNDVSTTSAPVAPFTGIQTEKEQITLQVVGEDADAEAEADAAMARVQRLCAQMDATAERLSAMTRDL